MSKDDILKEAIAAIVNGDESQALEVAKKAIAEGYDPTEILTDGFSAGIRQVGDLFGKGQVFLPELMLSAAIMKNVSVIFDEALAQSGQIAGKKGTMIMATVEGDVHDIGKGIVISLIKTQGIEVIDLGRDVPVATIIEKAEAFDVDLIGTSALLTTTLVEQKKLEDKLKQNDLKKKYKTMVGGAPATQRWADRIGADAYAEDAAEAVNQALALLQCN